MIQTVAQLLNSFIEQEKKSLDNYNLKHGPTIGKMYEGLTTDVLNGIIPAELKLQVVKGFIYEDSGQMSKQIDCMLVKGEGEKIPYTNDHKWHIKDVIAVFEVKKSLYGKELSEAYELLRGVFESYYRYITGGFKSNEVNIESSYRVYARITKRIPPPYSEIDKLPFNDQVLLNTLILEQLSPIRIVLGYHGYKSEFKFRESMSRYLSINKGKQGYGPRSFPQLIISGDYSLIKLNGQPYSCPIDNGFWHYYASSSENPILFILEFIWTRIHRDYDFGGFWGEDLTIETMNSFLCGKMIECDGRLGWANQYIVIEDEQLKKGNDTIRWSPVILNETQFVVINNLCSGNEESLDDPDLLSYLNSKQITMDDFTESLLETGLVALNGKYFELITERCQCVILPSGEYIAGEDNSGRLSRWVAKYIESRKKT